METTEKKDLAFLVNFIAEHKKAGKLSADISNKVERLWNKYKLDRLSEDCSIIHADFGFLGSLIIYPIKEVFGLQTLKYVSGSYDFVSIKSEPISRILWTDYANIEPYNRQSGLYCGGMSFQTLGNAVLEKHTYREFQCTDQHGSNITFAVWGYKYNDFYGSITFGVCLKKFHVDEFIYELRKIISK